MVEMGQAEAALNLGQLSGRRFGLAGGLLREFRTVSLCYLYENKVQNYIRDDIFRLLIMKIDYLRTFEISVGLDWKNLLDVKIARFYFDFSWLH
jgi:hypothetical protein